MKNYLSTTKEPFRRTSKTPKRSQRLLRFIIVAVIAVVVLRLLGGVFSYLGAFVLLPVKSVDTWLTEGTGTIPSYIQDRSNLLDRISFLEGELKNLESASTTIAVLTADNTLLQNLVGEEDDSGHIIAGIIGVPNELPYDVMVVDKGFEDGVEEGAVVYGVGDRVIGTVEKVFSNSAVVVLVTTSGVKSTAYVIGPNIYATAVGIGGGILQVAVPQGVPIEEGQPVILPGASPRIFGTISIIDPRPTRPAQYAYVHTGEPILSTRLVRIDRQVPDTVSYEEAQTIVSEAQHNVLVIELPEEGVSSATTSSSTVSE